VCEKLSADGGEKIVKRVKNQPFFTELYSNMKKYLYFFIGYSYREEIKDTVKVRKKQKLVLSNDGL
jgi:hypothetical protein